jgi:hypothetical protein
VANPAFVMAMIIQYEPYVDSTISAFLEVLEKRSIRAIDLKEWLYYFTWDVMGEVTYGERQGFVDAGDDVWDIFPSMRRKMNYGIYVSRRNALPRFLPDMLEGWPGSLAR